MSESLRCSVWGGFTARQVDTLAAYWVLVIVALHLGQRWLIVAGGILYSIGVIFHVWESLPFQNPIWHGFVLVASGCFYGAVFRAYAMTPAA